jgi:hypothetical protein
MNTKQLALVKLVFCGPNDVAKEIGIAKEIVEKWNQLNSEPRGLWVKHHHWLTDVYPDLAKRAQDVPNRQIIDPAKILVAIFWSRFGTPTGIADSGTQEEILRAADQGKKVMVYFSDLEPKPADADARQLDLLWQFRQSLCPRGIGWSFNSRTKFRELFENHLALALNAFEPQPKALKRTRKARLSVSQTAKSKRGNIHQHVGDNYYAHPPTEKIIRERRPGSVTTEEVNQIGEWIKELAEGEVDKTRDEAFAMWGSRFKNHFRLGHREDLPSTKMSLAEAWYRQQKAIQKRSYKTKAPDAFLSERIKSIKAAMNEMGKTNETYYPELSIRLKLKKPFTSLKKLTKRNLDRIYNMVLGDARKWRS